MSEPLLIISCGVGSPTEKVGDFVGKSGGSGGGSKFGIGTNSFQNQLPIRTTAHHPANITARILIDNLRQLEEEKDENCDNQEDADIHEDDGDDNWHRQPIGTW